MNYTGIRNARYLESGNIACEILPEGSESWLPFTSTPYDTAAHGRKIWSELTAGKWGEVTPFVATAEMLEKARQQKLEEIGNWRDEQENNGVIFEWNGHRWDGGKVAKARLSPVMSVADSGGLPDDFFWTDADNQDVAVTASSLKALDQAMTVAMVRRGFEIHRRQREMKEAVEAMNTLQEIRAYRVDWNE